MHYSSDSEMSYEDEPNVLVLCHGRNHAPKYPSAPEAILIDSNENSNPDITYDLTKKFYWELVWYLREHDYIEQDNFPDGYFDTIELRFCPNTIYQRGEFWKTLKALLHSDGEIIVYGLDETWKENLENYGFDVQHYLEQFDWGPPFPIDYLILTL